MKTKIVLTVISTILFCLPVVFAEDAPKMKETYYANAIALGRGLAGNLQITITRWTTPEERELLLKTLVEKGQDEMIKVLEKQEETGFLRLPNTKGYRLYYAHEIKDGAKRRIVLATDRPIAMAEAWRGGRSTDYAISLLQMDLDEKNEGEGWLGFAMELKMNEEKRTLEIENYGTDPVQLRAIRKKE